MWTVSKTSIFETLIRPNAWFSYRHHGLIFMISYIQYDDGNMTILYVKVTITLQLENASGRKTKTTKRTDWLFYEMNDNIYKYVMYKSFFNISLFCINW